MQIKCGVCGKNINLNYKICPYCNSSCKDISVIVDGSITKIKGGAFSDCSCLKSLVIPESVNRIGAYAFSGCSSLENIVIPDTVNQIGGYAFENCSSLKSVIISNSIELILYHNLDERCKKQQMGTGWFAAIDDVPKQAVSMTTYQVMQCERIVSCVPYKVKAEAIENTVKAKETTNLVPATLLKEHSDFILYLDEDSAAGILK